MVKKEETKILRLASSMNMKSIGEAAENGDLTYLKEQYKRITVMTLPFSLMPQYIAMLEEEQHRLDPFEAYAFGKRSKQEGITEKAALYGFLREHSLDPVINHEVDLFCKLHETVAVLLGSNLRYLIDDFPNEYRKIYGVVSYKIEYFIHLGYLAD